VCVLSVCVCVCARACVWRVCVGVCRWCVCACVCSVCVCVVCGCVWCGCVWCLCVVCGLCVSTSHVSTKTPVHSDSHFLLSLFITCLYSNPFSATAPQLSFIHLTYGLPSPIFQTISTRTLYLAVYCLPSLGRDRTAQRFAITQRPALI
jgi:hypothetical protein